MQLTLTSAARRALRARAHALHPVVMISGDNVSAPVLNEVDRALRSHELIKIRMFSDDHAVRTRALNEICDALAGAAVQHIGKILVIYRPLPPSAESKSPPRRRRKQPRRTKRSYQH